MERDPDWNPFGLFRLVFDVTPVHYHPSHGRWLYVQTCGIPMPQAEGARCRNVITSCKCGWLLDMSRDKHVDLGSAPPEGSPTCTACKTGCKPCASNRKFFYDVGPSTCPGHLDENKQMRHIPAKEIDRIAKRVCLFRLFMRERKGWVVWSRDIPPERKNTHKRIKAERNWRSYLLSQLDNTDNDTLLDAFLHREIDNREIDCSATSHAVRQIAMFGDSPIPAFRPTAVFDVVPVRIAPDADEPAPVDTPAQEFQPASPDLPPDQQDAMDMDGDFDTDVVDHGEIIAKYERLQAFTADQGKRILYLEWLVNWWIPDNV